MVEHFPWESAEGPKYYARELRPRKKWVTVGGWILSVVLLIAGFTTQYRVLLIFGLLYILTLLMEKTVAVTSRGLEIYYQMKITTHYDFWSWDQIQSVIREDKAYEGGLVALFFTNDIHSKKLFYTKEESAKVMALAEKCGGGRIFVGEGAAPKSGQSAGKGNPGAGGPKQNKKP